MTDKEQLSSECFTVHEEKNLFPQKIYLDLSEENEDNSIKFYHSKEGLKNPFTFVSISNKFKGCKENEY